MSITTVDKVEYSEAENQGALIVVKAYLITGFLVFLLMMLAGGAMRFVQGELVTLDPALFYQFLTVHGVGVIGISAFASKAVLWYFLRQYVPLSTKVFWLNFGIFLTGVVIILGSIFLGKYAGGWTFLYPLPGTSMGIWSDGAAAAFLVGLLIIGTGFLILYLDFGRAIIGRYGSLGRALGLPQLFGKEPVNPYHPATVVAGTMVVIVDFIGIAVGAVVLVMMLVNLYNPEFNPDALLVKNLIYFFGHVIINVAIYASVVAVYELLPRYTGRPYKTSKVFYAAWFAIVFMVMAVYPHHLYMDSFMPTWAVVGAQIISYSSGLPVMIVTGYGALMLVYRSGIQWNTSAKLLMLAIFGWAAGGIPAVIDSMAGFNLFYHNTLWVPGHFHFYLLLGLLPMIFGFTFFLLNKTQQEEPPLIEKLGFYSYVGGAFLLSMVFLSSGANGIPRRWAAYLSEWVPYAQWGALAAVLVVLGVLLFTLRVLTVLPKAHEPEPAPAH